MWRKNASTVTLGLLSLSWLITLTHDWHLWRVLTRPYLIRMITECKQGTLCWTTVFILRVWLQFMLSSGRLCDQFPVHIWTCRLEWASLIDAVLHVFSQFTAGRIKHILHTPRGEDSQFLVSVPPFLPQAVFPSITYFVLCPSTIINYSHEELYDSHGWVYKASLKNHWTKGWSWYGP